MVMYLGYFNRVFSMDVSRSDASQEVIIYFCSVVLWTRAPSPNPVSTFRWWPELHCGNVLKYITVSLSSEESLHSRFQHQTPKRTRMAGFVIMERCLTLLFTYLVSLLLKCNHLNVKFPNP